MSDKQFSRDLNSLVRRDERKRLPLPRKRAALPAGEGVSGAGVDTDIAVYELMYVRHYGGGITNVVYSYDKDGGSPVVVGSAVSHGGLGINGADVFGGDRGGTDVYKNGDVLVDTAFQGILIAVNSTHVIVQGVDGASYRVKRYTLAGAYVDTFLLPLQYTGSPTHTANDSGVGYIYDTVEGQSMAICDYSGTQVMSTPYTNWNYSYVAASCKSAIAFVDQDATAENFVFKVFSNDGVLIGTHTLPAPALLSALGGKFSTFGITSDRMYIFGASTSTPNCLIYEHTLTLDGGGAAISSTLGGLLHTVSIPQNNNYIYSDWQSTAVDAALFA